MVGTMGLVGRIEFGIDDAEIACGKHHHGFENGTVRLSGSTVHMLYDETYGYGSSLLTHGT
jgi:hypothetical protein